jgi:hypothetical protein
VLGESALKLAAGFRGILQGVREHIPIGLAQGKGFMFVDYLIGRMQGL